MIFSPSCIENRKQRAAEALTSILKTGEAVIVSSGTAITKPGGHDQTYPFLSHPEYFWLTGSRRPWGVSVFSGDEGWVDFVQPITREEKIWEGGGIEPQGRNLTEFNGWMEKKNFKQIFSLGQSESKAQPDNFAAIQESFSRVRRIKDHEEASLVRKLANLANAGYQTLPHYIKAGITERDIQLEYEGRVLRAGAEKMPYDTIVGTGSNSAVLHAIPTSRVTKDGELVLIDGGADLFDYCVDVTRVYPVNGKMNSRQDSIYQIVKKAQEKSIALCRPGTEWKDVHLASATVIAEGLVGLGILKGSVQDHIEAGSVSVFFPHGVGHMVGLRVRDVGGKPNPHPKKYAGSRLRVDLPLEENFLMTVEPGLYFIEALLKDEETRKQYKDLVNWDEALKWLDFGGIRIEDDILITKAGPDNLTSVIAKI